MRAARSIALPIFLLLAWTFLVAARAQELAVPELHQHVTDLTGTLSSGDISDFNASLEAFQQQTSNQIVVLMIPSLQGEALEDYSLRVAEKNKMGKKERNNGVLLLIVKDDHKMRIEVGYGLEGALTDALSSQIVRNEIAPSFRQGDYTAGIRAGIDAIEKATQGEYKGDEEERGGRGRNRLGPVAIIVLFIFFMIFSRIFGARRHYIGSRGYVSRGPWWGGPFGGGFGGGGFGGGGFGGGGGFSGGGGSFGGGGASGSW